MNTPTSAGPLRAAVVGLGAIGREHVDVYAASARADLVAVVDPRPEAVAEIAERTGARGFSSVEELLDAGGVDAVSLCTPDQLHHADAMRLIGAGVDLLCEKPIATDPAEADALVLAAEASSCVVMPGQTLRFEPRYHRARALVASGGVGEVAHGYLRRDNLTSVADRAGGRTSVAFFLGIHDIDALQWITGQRVVSAQAMASGALERTGSQSQAVLATLRLEGGAVVQMESAWNLPGDYPTELDAQLRLVGSAGVVAVTSFDAGMEVASGGFALPMTAGAPLYGMAQGALAVEIESFVSACLTRQAPPVSMREAASAVKVVVAIEEAVRTGRVVDVAEVASAPSAPAEAGTH